MFTAIRKDGTVLTLSGYSREFLEKVRQEELFYCPECKERVIMKLGTEQTWHFSHKPNSTCFFHKGETDDHRKGKEQIIQWLKRHGLDPKVEIYIKEIRRRPDILVEIQGREYVFEIQRAAIPYTDFERRSEDYAQLNIEPIWVGILSSIQLQENFIYSSCSLDNMLIRPVPCLHSIYVNVHDPSWLFLTEFCYVSRQKTMAFPHIVSFQLTPQEYLNYPKHKKTKLLHLYYDVFTTNWLREVCSKRLKVYKNVNRTERKLLRLFQQHHLNLNYFPALGSIPLKTNFYFLTPPQWWQSWVILEKINKKPVGEKVTISEVTNDLYKLTLSSIFQIRSLHKHPKELIREAVMDFLTSLALFLVLEKELPGVFKVKNHINIHKQLDTLCLDDVYVLSKMKEVWTGDILP
ncbi:MAG: hypothetical protein LRY73_00645 [Bacillus sp. (in: Bacteria)]|nr:hypothetical protein [Bacillus sp. (in: firmicutes)]